MLLQRGKGADAGAGFGAGASGTVFGARGSASFLSRTTATLAALFIATSLTLAYMGGRKTEAPTSVIDRVQAPADTAAHEARLAACAGGASRRMNLSRRRSAPATRRFRRLIVAASRGSRFVRMWWNW